MEEFGQAREVEERIHHALEGFDNGKFKTLRDAADKHHVPYTRIYAHYHDRPSKIGRPGTNKRLNPEQEAALRLYIRRCNKIGYSALPHMIYDAATCILKESRLNPTIPIRPLGRDWVSRILACNPDIEKYVQKPKDKNRIDAQKRESIIEYFEKFKRIVAERGILPSDCWNFDETGFRIGCGGKQIVITLGARDKPKKDRKSFTVASETNRDYLTSVEAISAAGEVIPPMLILKAVQHLFQWYAHTHIPDNYLLGVSDTGYNNDELALDWIQHFEKYSAQFQRGVWRLLIFDGFGAHLTKQFIDYCDKHNIIPFSLPSHTSHLLQPLDVTVFQPFKHWHKKTVEVAVRTGCIDFNKVEFLHEIQSIRSRTFKKGMILSAWEKSGLFPLNPEIVLQKIPRPQTPPPEESIPPSSPLTPYTPKATIGYSITMRNKVLEGRGVTKKRFDRYIRGTVAQSLALRQAKCDLSEIQKEVEQRQKRQQRDGRVIQSGGTVYAKDGQEAVLKRKQQVEEKAAAAAERAQKKKKPKTNNPPNDPFI
jgi:hypothetical protein